MSDDSDGSAIEPGLLEVLSQYAPKGMDDRDVWRDRIMDWPGASERDLTRWHGALVAAAWLEQNTGQTPSIAAGQVCGCYRVTQAGRRALRNSV